jgi:lysine 2,3-aminomutase
MVSQTVLLGGVNDCPHILLKLFETLVSIGVKPYYLFQLDEVTGAIHFKVSVDEGIRFMHFLREHGSGLAIPHYAIDITGGPGKVPIDYQYLKRRDGSVLYLETPSGESGRYADNGEMGQCHGCGICGQGNAEIENLRR